MIRKTLSIIATTIILLVICGNVYASELNTRLDVVQNLSEIKSIENGQASIVKKIIDSNSETGEVTVEVKVANTAKNSDVSGGTEIFIVLDNSGSMNNFAVKRTKRKDLIVNAANSLVDSIFREGNDIKVGVVTFNTEASLTGSLTSDKAQALNYITTYANTNPTGATDVHIGVKVADDSFTDEENTKVVVLLSDGLSTQYDDNGNIINNINTVDAMTKEYLQTVGERDMIISMLTGVSTESTDSDEARRVPQIFGTEANPTTGKFYNILDADIEKVVTVDIYTDVMNIVQRVMKDIKVLDYFPEIVVQNFDFSIVGQPSKGTVEEAYSQAKNLSWNIPELKREESATLTYKLQIKDMKNVELINKIIPTNEKIDIEYKKIRTKLYNDTLTDSPKVKLTKIIEPLNIDINYDQEEDEYGNVIVTITANKNINNVEGWNLSNDGTSLTKTFTESKEERVKITDEDGQEEEIIVKVDIKVKEPEPTPEPTPDGKEDDTTYTDIKIPQTGVGETLIILSMIFVVSAIVMIKKFVDLK